MRPLYQIHTNFLIKKINRVRREENIGDVLGYLNYERKKKLSLSPHIWLHKTLELKM